MNIFVLNKLKTLKIILVFTVLVSSIIGSKNYLIDVYNSSSSLNKLNPIASVDIKEPNLALTFDISTNTSNLKSILSTLKEEEVVATFFVTGSFAKKYPELIKEIHDLGHEIGNHSHTHKHMTGLTDEEILNEIKACHEAIKENLGFDMNLFRCPYNEWNNDVILACYGINYFPISFNIDSEDYNEYGIEALEKAVTKSKTLGNGSIIGMNVESKYTSVCLKEIIKNLKAKNFMFVKTSNLIHKDNYVITNNGTQKIKQ